MTVGPGYEMDLSSIALEERGTQGVGARWMLELETPDHGFYTMELRREGVHEDFVAHDIGTASTFIKTSERQIFI